MSSNSCSITSCPLVALAKSCYNNNKRNVAHGFGLIHIIVRSVSIISSRANDLFLIAEKLNEKWEGGRNDIA